MPVYVDDMRARFEMTPHLTAQTRQANTATATEDRDTVTMAQLVVANLRDERSNSDLPLDISALLADAQYTIEQLLKALATSQAATAKGIA